MEGGGQKKWLLRWLEFVRGDVVVVRLVCARVYVYVRWRQPALDGVTISSLDFA
jgi:hypothetical protein